MKTAVLVSGGGTNLQSLLDAEREGSLGRAKVVVVVSNKPEARALERARTAGVEALVLAHTGHPSRESYDTAMRDALTARGVELVVLAGFMRIVTPTLLSAFPDRVINIHPSLLPAFPGLHAQRQALAYGAKVAGCTVHFVDPGMDTGPVILQRAVTVEDGDTEDTLSARILAEEHRALPAVVAAISEGRVQRDGRTVRILG